MNDKIITTFETTLTWYCPTDKLPEEKYAVLIALKEEGHDVTLAIREEDKFFTFPSYPYSIEEIMWWTYVPEFE